MPATGSTLDAASPAITLDPLQKAAAATMEAQATIARLEAELAVQRQTQGREPTRNDTQETGHRRDDRETQRRGYRADSRDRSRSRSRGRVRDYERREGRGRNRDRTRSRDRYRDDRSRRPRSDSRDRPRDRGWRLERAARQEREDARRIASRTAPRPLGSSITNASGIDSAYVQPKNRPGGSHPTVHPYQPTLGTQPGPGGNTGLSSEIMDISGPGPNPAATQSNTDAGTAGSQTCHQGNLDRDEEEERDAQARAEETYAAMEEDLQLRADQDWKPPTVNLSPRLRGQRLTGPSGEINEIPWDQDATYRRYHSHPPP